MEKYIPDMYKKSIYDINYEALKERGIRCLLFDLDNTIIPIREKDPHPETIQLFKKLKNSEFKISIVSNSMDKRVRRVADTLEVPYVCMAQKPNISKINDLISYFKASITEVAIIGDSMMDDIVCGNHIGITTILIDQLEKHEFPFAKLKRVREHHIQKKLRDKDLFTKGRYYE